MNGNTKTMKNLIIYLKNILFPKTQNFYVFYNTPCLNYKVIKAVDEEEARIVFKEFYFNKTIEFVEDEETFKDLNKHYNN